MTNWAEICAAAMVYIDDVRLTEQLSISPALYYRRMSLFVSSALPILKMPPELLDYLLSEKVEPQYGDFYWTSTEESIMQETAVETGMTGYSLCSCIITELQPDGRTLQTPYEVEYDPDTGIVTFPEQESANITYELDFYTDGSFATLSDSQMRLYALAVALIWEERFYTSWLDRTPKIHDSSFTTVNEANYTEKTSQALQRTRLSFYDALRDYEQLCAYKSVVTKSTSSKVVLA